MHNIACPARARPGALQPPPPHAAAGCVVRAAAPADAERIASLVNGFAAEGLMLPRTREQIVLTLDDYVVAASAHGRVVACAALDEYSPSLAEVASVAVDRAAHGRGLGRAVVLAAEDVARRRGITELFAMTLSDRFFASLGYEPTRVERYPEKLARYARLARAGLQIVPKSCFRKLSTRADARAA